MEMSVRSSLKIVQADPVRIKWTGSQWQGSNWTGSESVSIAVSVQVDRVRIKWTASESRRGQTECHIFLSVVSFVKGGAAGAESKGSALCTPPGALRRKG